ncbi:MAG: FAD-dependent oxidoreductase, partial [Christensenellales bacterium]
SGSREIDGLFVAIGRTPETQLMDGVELDSFGYVLADEFMRTNIPGVYAAGDVRQKFLRQIVTACADGAIAAEHILSNH